MVLEKHPQASLWAIDGSPEMLARARQSLAAWGSRFNAAQYNLQDADWRSLDTPASILPGPARAVISSMAVHHLDGEEKAALFRDLYHLLAPGGALILADIIAPVDPHWQAAAAAQFDDVVRQRSKALDGNLLAFEYFQREHWNIYHYPDAMDKPSPIYDQLGWLGKAGFIHADVYWMKAGHAIYGAFRPPA
jgi:tRNA (cmo5U34)-methyltransferase